MNQLQAIPITAVQVQGTKASVKKAETPEQEFSTALRKLVGEKQEQEQDAVAKESEKQEASTIPEESGEEEETKTEQTSMELLQQLAAGTMMQRNVPVETVEVKAEIPVEVLAPVAAVEQPKAELPTNTHPPTQTAEVQGEVNLDYPELPKVGAQFTVVQVDENGVPIGETAKVVAAPVQEEKLQTDEKHTDVPKVEAPKAEVSKVEAPKVEAPKVEVPKTEVAQTEAPQGESMVKQPEKTAVQTEIPASQTMEKPVPKTEQVKTETAEKPQTETSLYENRSDLVKPTEPQVARPTQQEASVKVEKLQPQQMEQPVEAAKPEEVQKPVTQTEASAEVSGTMPQIRETVSVKTEPITVSQPEKTVAMQFADKLATFESTSKTEFQMQLFPEDLGEVTVKMAVRDGVMVIDILSPNSKTQQILLSNADDIKNMLQSQLQQRTQVVIPTEERPAEYYHQQREQSQHQQQERESQPEQKRQENEISYTGDFLTAFREIRLAAGRN